MQNTFLKIAANLRSLFSSELPGAESKRQSRSRITTAGRALNGNDHRLGGLALAIAAGVLILDLRIELGFAAGIVYIPVILIASLMRSVAAISAAAILSTTLILIGYGMSPESGEMWKAVSNRGVSLLALWMTAILLTEQKRMEIWYRNINKDLTDLNQTLAQSNLSLKQFASIASHDLRAPLSSILGYAALLRDEHSKPYSAEEAEWLDQIALSAESMNTLITDLLDVSCVDAPPRNRLPIPMEEALDAAIERLQSLLEASNAEVTHDPLPSVLANRSQMIQLLQNLLENAIKYRSEKPPRIHLSSSRNGGDWQIFVRDNGIGIKPDCQALVFEMHRQLDESNRRGGAGIGLAVCKRIVERHGGQINVASEHGKGSVFSFTLPDGDSADSPRADAGQPTPQSTRS